MNFLNNTKLIFKSVLDLVPAVLLAIIVAIIAGYGMNSLNKNFKEISNRVDNFLYIDRIAVDAKYRNNKLGTSLYKNILNYAKENSIEHLTAEINLLPSINEASFKFHESFGFEELGSVKYSEDYEVSLQKLAINS